MTTAVGRSDSRTPLKHWILNQQLGKLVGSLSTGLTPARPPFAVFDLCAGDGETQGGASSPSIIVKHGHHAYDRGVPYYAFLVERAPATFEQLKANLSPLPAWVRAECMDAREIRVKNVGNNQAVFIHADPNSIADWPISRGLLDSLTPTTTVLATMGCNVGGLKRLPAASRADWYEYVEMITGNLPSFHDVLLITLEGDASQWAYMLRLPTKWRDDTAADLFRRGRRFTSYELGIVALKKEPAEFAKQIDVLFKTARERGDE